MKISSAISRGSPVMTDHWRERIEVMLGRFPRLLAVSVHNKLGAEGFEGSYPTVVRAVRGLLEGG